MNNSIPTSNSSTGVNRMARTPWRNVPNMARANGLSPRGVWLETRLRHRKRREAASPIVSAAPSKIGTA